MKQDSGYKYKHDMDSKVTWAKYILDFAKCATHTNDSQEIKENGFPFLLLRNFKYLFGVKYF